MRRCRWIERARENNDRATRCWRGGCKQRLWWSFWMELLKQCLDALEMMNGAHGKMKMYAHIDIVSYIDLWGV